MNDLNNLEEFIKTLNKIEHNVSSTLEEICSKPIDLSSEIKSQEYVNSELKQIGITLRDTISQAKLAYNQFLAGEYVTVDLDILSATCDEMLIKLTTLLNTSTYTHLVTKH